MRVSFCMQKLHDISKTLPESASKSEKDFVPQTKSSYFLKLISVCTFWVAAHRKSRRQNCRRLAFQTKAVINVCFVFCVINFFEKCMQKDAKQTLIHAQNRLNTRSK